MEKDLLNRLMELLPQDLIVGLEDMATERARAAHEAIRDRFPYLSHKPAKALEGQARFRVLEQGFQMVCEQHGGILLENGLIEGSDLRIYQPFMRFGGNRKGIILGLASMPIRKELPVKNMSRKAGVLLNYRLTPRLSLDERDPKLGDIFLLFLFARDPKRAGFIEEIAIGIIDAEYKSFLFYESADVFMVRYASSKKSPEIVIPREPLVKLKPFKLPEASNKNKNIQENNGTG